MDPAGRAISGPRPAHATGAARPTAPWRTALVFAVPITALIVGLMIAWFALGNRYVVFLYYHDMGPRVPDTRPFSPVTRSRYWMTGLVASGMVLVLTTGISWLLGRLVRGYRPPAWWRIWLLCAAPLAAAIPAITMTTNSPTLPPWLAALTTLATLAGLALALQPAALAAEDPLALALLGLEGMALASWLLTLRGLASVGDWLASGRTVYVVSTAVLLAGGAGGLGTALGARALLRRPPPTLGRLVIAAACCAYLALPLAHYVLGSDGQFYISDMDNFFSRAPAIQALTWAATFALAAWASVIRSRQRPS